MDDRIIRKRISTMTTSRDLHNVLDIIKQNIATLIPQHYSLTLFISAWATKSYQDFATSEFSLTLVLRKEDKQNSNMTWQI